MKYEWTSYLELGSIIKIFHYESVNILKFPQEYEI